MTRSDDIGELLAALVAALGEMPATIVPGRTGQTGHRTYPYADLPDLLEPAKPALLRHGVLLYPEVENDAQEVRAVAVAFHAPSGQMLQAERCVLPIPAVDPQEIGKLRTYAARYVLREFLTLYARSDDDDAQSAHERATPSRRRAAATPDKPPAAKPTAESIAAARERLEQAAGRGSEALFAELAGTPPEIIAAIGGTRHVAQLKARAKEADSEVAPA